MKNRLCTWTLAVLALAGAAQAQVVSYSVANETGCATGTGFVAGQTTVSLDDVAQSVAFVDTTQDTTLARVPGTSAQPRAKPA